MYIVSDMSASQDEHKRTHMFYFSFFSISFSSRHPYRKAHLSFLIKTNYATHFMQRKAPLKKNDLESIYRFFFLLYSTDNSTGKGNSYVRTTY